MEIKKENRFKTFIKRFGAYILAAFVVILIAATATVAGVLTSRNNNDNPVDVVTEPISFGLPVASASVIKDFSDTKLQFNETLKKWEAHFSVDLTGGDLNVMAVADGTVADVFYKYMDGYCVTIQHKDGFTSVYTSLDENVDVKKGDTVNKGQKIGQMSTSAAGESSYGAHVDFSLYQNGKSVDPNNYISLQNK